MECNIGSHARVENLTLVDASPPLIRSNGVFLWRWQQECEKGSMTGEEGVIFLKRVSVCLGCVQAGSQITEKSTSTAIHRSPFRCREAMICGVENCDSQDFRLLSARQRLLSHGMVSKEESLCESGILELDSDTDSELFELLISSPPSRLSLFSKRSACAHVMSCLPAALREGVH
jgi:hypothetical protein